MAYKSFTASQRATVKALVAEMRDLSALWIDVQLPEAKAWETRAEMIDDIAGDWDVDGSFQPPADYIRSLRESVRACRRSQADVFAAIRALGFSIRKTDCSEYRVAKRIPFHASRIDRDRAEDGAAYCSDLAEALATACSWAQDRADAADRRKRDQLLAGFEDRARQLLAAKRAVYGDRFATAAEAEMQAEDPLAWLELIAEQLTAETGLTYRGSWATESEIESATAAAAAEDLDQQAARARLFSAMTAQPSDDVDTYAPSPAQLGEIERVDAANRSASSLEAEEIYQALAEGFGEQPSPEAVAQLVKGARAALFALESAIYLQGLKALCPAALQLHEALEPFHSNIEGWAEAQMRAAALAGRSDLAA